MALKDTLASFVKPPKLAEPVSTVFENPDLSGWGFSSWGKSGKYWTDQYLAGLDPGPTFS